jgi:hypothetical protein
LVVSRSLLQNTVMERRAENEVRLEQIAVQDVMGVAVRVRAVLDILELPGGADDGQGEAQGDGEQGEQGEEKEAGSDHRLVIPSTQWPGVASKDIRFELAESSELKVCGLFGCAAHPPRGTACACAL